MSEVSKTSGGGQERGTAKAGAKAGAKPKKTKEPVNMKSNKTTQVKVPQKPVPKIITVTAGSGCSLGYLAEVHNTTVAEIMKLNPDIKNAVSEVMIVFFIINIP